MTKEQEQKQMKTLNEYAAECHAANKKWWQNVETGEPIKRNPKELLALVISELSEALEGERKGLMDDKLPHRKMPEVEMADAFIRLCDFAGGFGHSLEDGVSDEAARWPVPTNRGEALFGIAEKIVSIPYSYNRCENISICLGMIRAYCRKFGYDLEGAYAEKMAFNATRKDHTHEARKQAGGKRF